MKKRREYVAVLTFLAAIIGISGCSRQKEEKLTKYDTQFFELFDTVTSVTGYARDEKTFQSYVDVFYDELKEYHQLYDIYNDYEGINNIKTINDHAGIEPVEVDDKIIQMLEEAVDIYELTDGNMNVAMGSVLSIWHEYREAGLKHPEQAQLPPQEELEEAAKHMDIRKMVIDPEKKTVYLEDPDMSLDVGAIAKGYAAEMASRKVEEAGLKHALISVGGNIRCIGTKPDGQKWIVGVQNPDTTSGERYLHRLGLDGMSLVTSGTYQRYYTVDGVNYHHIIHPELLKPWDRYSSVSILSADSGMADALATAVFNMELEDGKKLIESQDGVEAMWIEADGTEHYSSGFRNDMLND